VLVAREQREKETINRRHCVNNTYSTHFEDNCGEPRSFIPLKVSAVAFLFRTFVCLYNA